MLLKGSAVSAELNEKIQEQAMRLREKGIVPTIGIIRVGEKPDDISYERSVIKRCGTLGIEVQTFLLPADSGTEELIQIIDYVNQEKSIHGVLMFSPLPKQIDEDLVRNRLLPSKDLDGICPGSLYGVFAGKPVGYPPCTPDACMRILEHYGIDLKGKRAVIIGRSMVVGRPLAMMMMQKNATVTICHTKTLHPEEIAREADILVAAAGQAHLITKDYVKPGQIVLDVGIHPDGENGFCGDVCFDEVSPIAESITPVPGGVGNVTTSVLLTHLMDAAVKAESDRNA